MEVICIQRSRPVIAPVGRSKSNWEVFALLAAAMGFAEPIFRQSAEEMMERLIATARPMRQGIDMEAFNAGKAVTLTVDWTPGIYATPSGKVEILNPALEQPLPEYIAPHGGSGPLCLLTAPSLYALNSSFYERDDLRRKQDRMRLMMNPEDAANRNLMDGQRVWPSTGWGKSSSSCAAPKRCRRASW
jgi:anaerobic selenocysteine-containing dehydrogenase